VRVLITGYQPMSPSGSLPLTFQIRDARTGKIARTVDTFRAP
jgi:hypothetical protein